MPEGTDIQSTTTADELPAGTEVGGYVVEGKIGEGGMGVVYGALHPRIGKRVAIKVLSPAFCGDPATVERFEQEARLVNEIKHPNIVDVFQFGELSDGRSFFVMEWLEGESLSARLERGPLSTRETLDVLDAICDALEAAHEKGVIHRDLKSDNVFIVPVRKDKKVKLLDFGLAKLAGRSDPVSIHKTKEGIVVGTPAYMSPEQARGKTVDVRTDIYALGCLGYKMVTGRLPFHADNAMDLIVKQLNDAPPSPSKLAPNMPPSLSRTIVRMMAKSREERPSLADIRQTIADLRETKQPVKKSGRALSVLIGFLLFLCGVITLGVIGLIKQRDDGPASPAAAPPPAAGAAAPAPVGSAVAPTPPEAAPTIEFDDDKIGSTKHVVKPSAAEAPSSPSGAGTRTADDSGSGDDLADDVVKPPVGTIMLMLDVSSQIELDGKVISTDSKVGRFEVIPGQHSLRVTAPGREAVSRTVDVEAGGTAVLRIGDDTARVTPPADKPAPDKPAPDKPASDTPSKPKKSEDGVYDPASDQVVPQD
jgi:serine/threonine protein kinase